MCLLFSTDFFRETEDVFLKNDSRKQAYVKHFWNMHSSFSRQLRRIFIL